MQPRRDDLVSIQFLRGVAAFLVMFHHAQSEAIQEFGFESVNRIPIPGGIGVDVFFVISGFIMVYASRELFGRKAAPVEFIKRRLIRIVPLYWFYTTSMLMAMLIFPDRLNDAEFDIYNIISSCLFFPASTPRGEISPILDIGWTLNYEMFFYIIFACVIMFPLRRAVAAVIVAITAIVFLGILLPTPIVPLRFWTNSIILEFAFGCGLGYIYLFAGRRALWLPFFLVVGAGLVWYCFGQFGYISYIAASRAVFLGISAALLVCGFVFFMPVTVERAVRPIARWFGDSSYSLYLSHPFTLAIVAMFWPPRFDEPYAFLLAAAAAAAAVCVGICSYLIIERPVTASLKGLAAKRLAPASTAAA